MTDRDGLSLCDAVAWCGGEITLQEATRIRRLVNGPQTAIVMAIRETLACNPLPTHYVE
jgi:hypothetical protein